MITENCDALKYAYVHARAIFVLCTHAQQNGPHSEHSHGSFVMLKRLQMFNVKYSYYDWLRSAAMASTTISMSVLLILGSLGFVALATELSPKIFGALTFLIAHSVASMWLIYIGVLYDKITSDIAVKAGISSMTLAAVLCCVSACITHYLVFYVSSVDTLPPMKHFLFSWNESMFYAAMVSQMVEALLFGAFLREEIVSNDTTPAEKTE